MSATNTKPINLQKLIIICTTLVLLAGVGAWVYVSRQNIAQKNKELQQQKQLTEYEQEQLNKRNEADNRVKRLNGLDDSDDGLIR